ncbi:Flavonol synthase [Handroanthus impetiginosus]|uniref:Flavonol synthase n=1 Tax=Handroanthus impetiginosus TaxID=429701 RepID=A0A2G9G6F8_9LAMI|nr:Flavonol synthase [Handroanthus impetiginosus]
MAATASTEPSSNVSDNSSVKALAESSTLQSIPSQFTFANDSRGSHCDSIPILDFSLLTSPDPDQRAELLQDLDKACREWAIGENLGLEEGYIDEALKPNSCFQLYAANFYPPCPQPHQAIGIPAHTDHGLLTFLIHNEVAGLQIQHDGEWFNNDSPQNFILVNTYWGALTTY